MRSLSWRHGLRFWASADISLFNFHLHQRELWELILCRNGHPRQANISLISVIFTWSLRRYHAVLLAQKWHLINVGLSIVCYFLPPSMTTLTVKTIGIRKDQQIINLAENPVYCRADHSFHSKVKFALKSFAKKKKKKVWVKPAYWTTNRFFTSPCREGINMIMKKMFLKSISPKDKENRRGEMSVRSEEWNKRCCIQEGLPW